MYRKDFTQLTTAEKTALASAWNTLWTTTSFIQDAAALHDVNFYGGRIHWCPTFLYWHRDFLRKLELALQAIDPSINLPYWDWTRSDSRNIDIEPWESFFGGRDNSGGNFDSWTYNRRSNDGGRVLPSLADVIDELDAPSFTEYRKMETGTHPPGHTWTGGTMAGGASPLDPLFFLHHCNLDRLWAIWQQNNPGLAQYDTTSIPSDGNASTTVVIGVNDPIGVGATASPNDLVDHTALGYKYERDILLEIAWFEAKGTHLKTGDPRPADLLIRDSAADTGAYPSPVPHWTSPDIWVRNQDPTTPGEDPNDGHQPPIVNAVNYLYVNVKNNGTVASSGNSVEAFNCTPGTGMLWPDHFNSMGTLPITGSIAPGATVRVGPFLWTPTVVDHECLLAIANTADDPQSAPMFRSTNPPPAAQTPVPHWHLVRFENSVGQRNVSPVLMALGGKMKTSFRFSGGIGATDNILRIDATALPNDTEIIVTVPLAFMDNASTVGMTELSRNLRYARLQVTPGINTSLAGIELPSKADRTVKLEIDFSMTAVHEQKYPLIVSQDQNGILAGTLTIELIAIKESEDYVYGNPRSMELHTIECPYWNMISPKNKIPYNGVQDGLLRGYDGCAFCLSDHNTG